MKGANLWVNFSYLLSKKGDGDFYFTPFVISNPHHLSLAILLVAWLLVTSNDRGYKSSWLESLGHQSFMRSN